jgi:hypothetical protein
MWQDWQVGAAVVSGSVPFCLSSARTPCFEAEYISHCGWSKPMWQVWQAWGWRASLREKAWRVWHASQEATPKPRPCCRSSLCSASLLRPILWQPPQPFMPSIIATGWAWALGIAFIAAQARACLPFLNCATCASWHVAHTSGVGMAAFAASPATLCSLPWQASQLTPATLCLLVCQSATMPGCWRPWQSTQVSAAAEAEARSTTAGRKRTAQSLMSTSSDDGRDSIAAARAGQDQSRETRLTAGCRR